MMMTAKPMALGYLRQDISGAHRAWDETQIRSLAKRLGYDLVDTVVLGSDTDHRILHLLNVVRTSGAEAVIAPCLDHLDGTVDPLVETCDVITVRPENTYARWAFPRAQADN
ncbi:hypothetical protein GCM10023319_18550 [Nocardia iowensis]